VVVLGRDEDERIGRVHLRDPSLRVLVLVLPQPRMIRLVEQRETCVSQIDELDIEAAMCPRTLEDPLRKPTVPASVTHTAESRA